MTDHAPHTRADRLLTDEELQIIGMGEPPRRDPDETVAMQWLDDALVPPVTAALRVLFCAAVLVGVIVAAWVLA